MKKLAIILIFILLLIILVYLGVPALAQTQLATLILGQPLSTIAARQIITHSGLPIEQLPDGTTNEITRARDSVNAYRYAHGQISKFGYYKGISNDHTPLLIAMVNELTNQGFTSNQQALEEKTADVLQKFWYSSDTENAKELGYASLEEMINAIEDMLKTGKQEDANSLLTEINNKWK